MCVCTGWVHSFCGLSPGRPPFKTPQSSSADLWGANEQDVSSLIISCFSAILHSSLLVQLQQLDSPCFSLSEHCHWQKVSLFPRHRNDGTFWQFQTQLEWLIEIPCCLDYSLQLPILDFVSCTRPSTCAITSTPVPRCYLKASLFASSRQSNPVYSCPLWFRVQVKWAVRCFSH